MVLYLFPAWLFWGYDGCESVDGGCDGCGGVGWCGSAGVVEVFCSWRMGVGVGSVGNRGESVVSRGGDASVADGGGAKRRDCCRFPDGIFGELQEDLPYCLPFTLNITDFFS